MLVLDVLEPNPPVLEGHVYHGPVTKFPAALLPLLQVLVLELPVLNVLLLQPPLLVGAVLFESLSAALLDALPLEDAVLVESLLSETFGAAD